MAVGREPLSLAAVARSLRSGLIVVDGEGLIQEFNEAAATLFGRTRASALGRPIQEVIPGTGLLRVLTTGQPESNVRFETADRALIVDRTPIVDDGQVVGVAALFQDASELEEVSRQLGVAKALNEDLQALNRELEAIFDSSFDEIFVADGEGICLRVNAASERLYGLKAQDLLGRRVDELEKDGIFSPSGIRLALEEKQRVTIAQETRSGRRVVVTANPVLDEAGRVVRVVANSRDVTELVSLRAQLQETEERARRYGQELRSLRQEVTRIPGLVAQSSLMQRVIDLVRKVAGVDTTVLLLGESGVGKNALARAIHLLSARKDGPFIEVNCGAIPEHLLESELFGYDPGAFTGARREGKAGILELANGGTLFLNEIGELPPSLQVKLLAVLQDRQVTRVGGTRSRPIDMRVLAATNRDLAEMVGQGRFREDLYYRLNVVPLQVPPLRQRSEDIPALLHHFLEENNRRYGRTRRLSRAAADRLLEYQWPGNIRELQNLVERLVVTADDDLIREEDLPALVRTGGGANPAVGPGRGGGSGPRTESAGGRQEGRANPSLRQAVQELERELIGEALRLHGSTHRAARSLGVSQATVVRKMQQLKLKVSANSV